MNLTQEQWQTLRPYALAGVEYELASGAAPETTETLRRLVRQGYSRDNALDLIARVYFKTQLAPHCEARFLAETYGASVSVGLNFDRYREALRPLPRQCE